MTTITKADLVGMNEGAHLHPVVGAILAKKDYAFVYEYQYFGGAIDFLAIHRKTGRLAIVECKMFIGKRLEPLIDQVNRYYSKVAVPSASKWVFTFRTDNCEDAKAGLNAEGIDLFFAPIKKRLKYPSGSYDEFCWYYHKWHKEPLLVARGKIYRTREEHDLAEIASTKARDEYPYHRDTSGDVWPGPERFQFGTGRKKRHPVQLDND